MCSYHAYRKHWTTVVVRETVLSTKREPWNWHDRCAVAVIWSRKIVGHVPRQIAKECSTFIKRKGIIQCKVTGEPQQQEIAAENKGSLEVPCIYRLSSNDQKYLSEIAIVLQKACPSLAEPVDNSYWDTL